MLRVVSRRSPILQLWKTKSKPLATNNAKPYWSRSHRQQLLEQNRRFSTENQASLPSLKLLVQEVKSSFRSTWQRILKRRESHPGQVWTVVVGTGFCLGLTLYQSIIVVPLGEVGVFLSVTSSTTSNDAGNNTSPDQNDQSQELHWRIFPPGWHFQLQSPFSFRGSSHQELQRWSTQTQYVTTTNRVSDGRGNKVMVTVLIQYQLVDPSLYILWMNQQPPVDNLFKHNNFTFGHLQACVEQATKAALAEAVSQQDNVLDHNFLQEARPTLSKAVQGSLQKNFTMMLQSNSDNKNGSQHSSPQPQQQLQPQAHPSLSPQEAHTQQQQRQQQAIQIHHAWIVDMEPSYRYRKLVQDLSEESRTKVIQDRHAKLAKVQEDGAQEVQRIMEAIAANNAPRR